MSPRQSTVPTDGSATAATLGQKRSFDAVGRMFHATYDPVGLCVSLYVAPTALTAVGAFGRALVGPMLTLDVCAGLVTLYSAIGSWRGTHKDRTFIDWSTVPAHEESMRRRVSADAMNVIDEAARWVGYRRGGQVHRYLITCACDAAGDQSSCVCRARWTAGVLTHLGSAHRVIAAGDRLLDAPLGVVRFVLAHERRHVFGWPHYSFRARMLTSTAGFVVVGALVPPGLALIMTAVGLVLACTAWGWSDEIVCDIYAARRHGASAPGWLDGAKEIQAKRKRIAGPWWQRPLTLAASALPQHPPLRLRAWICRNTPPRHSRTH